jgi:uncharacterized protein YndB with AHSA1/START domain
VKKENQRMMEGQQSVVVDRPIEQVFEFVTNPENEKLWVPNVMEQIIEAKVHAKISLGGQLRGLKGSSIVTVTLSYSHF